jgi:hypothetical protein
VSQFGNIASAAISQLESHTLIFERLEMSSNPKVLKEDDSKFTYGVRELREAKAAAAPALAIEEKTTPKTVDKNLGFDPYNTSGSFDRKKNWTRVGKR